MVDVFKRATENILRSISDNSKGKAIICSATHGNYQVDIDINRDVAIVNEFTEARGDDAVSYADTATFLTRDVTVGDTIKTNTRTWVIGRTIDDDGYSMTVIIT